MGCDGLRVVWHCRRGVALLERETINEARMLGVWLCWKEWP